MRAQELRFDEDGLVRVAVQNVSTMEVVMVASANLEAIQKTLETGLAHYFSRSRNELWLKGVTSGHYQRVVAVRVNCENNSLLYQVEMEGPGCHKGTATCFYRELER